jgi:transposase
VIWWQLRWVGISGLDPVGEYCSAIRNRAEPADFICERSVYEPQRKTQKRKTLGATEGLPMLHRHAAGIDVGNAEHYVAVPPDRDARPVQKFGSFTADLQRMARWLQACGIETVVMQATGVYWVALFEVLQSYGLQVQVVNAQHTKTLPGRKTDVQECQWLQKLHSFGLLNPSFRPAEEIRVLRSYLRQRENLVSAASTCVQHMQKALTEMNVQLANVISDITGVTGMAIRRALMNGERDPRQLAELKHKQIRASREEIARSLEGHWRAELIFTLGQSLELYDFHLAKIQECDERIEAQLKTMEPQAEVSTHPMPASRQGRKIRQHGPRFDLRQQLYRLTGVDLTEIDGFDLQVAQTVISEIGVDMSHWKTENHFSSWLGLSPDNRTSGGKVLKRGTRHVVNRAATALRLAAWNLIRSQSALGAKFRRLRTRLGAPKAITAMAHHLARLVYRMLKFGTAYVDQGSQHYEAKYRLHKIKWLQKQAAALNLQLIPAQGIAQ